MNVKRALLLAALALLGLLTFAGRGRGYKPSSQTRLNAGVRVIAKHFLLMRIILILLVV